MPVSWSASDIMTAQTQNLVYNLLFALAVFLLLAIEMLPSGLRVGPLPQPDLLFCIIAAWKLRRPGYIHPIALVGALLLSELLFLMPLGLWTALVLLASEYFRTAATKVRFLPFTFEWITMASTYTVIFLTYQFVLSISFVSAPGAQATVLHVLATAAAYPLVVAVTNILFRIRKSSSIRTGLLEGED